MSGEGLDGESAEAALRLLGDVLEARGEHYEIVVIGGTCLLLSGMSVRVTRDVDVVAQMVGADPVRVAEIPSGLDAAARDVGRRHGLPPNWLNAGPAGMVESAGLPPGIEQRLERRAFGGLVVYLAGRLDMVAFKVFAAADHYGDSANKHLGDLRVLEPTHHELAFAEQWCREQDSSAAFAELLEAVMTEIGGRDAQ